jgi:hypothetical protein
VAILPSKITMLNVSTYRSANWLALLASLVFVAWPSLVVGNCCCEANEQPKSSLVIVHAASCSQTQSSCCAKKDQGESDSSCGNSCDEIANCCGRPADHKCGVSCCRGLVAVAVTSAVPNHVESPALLLAESRIEFPSGLEVRSSELPDSPLHFLLAQDHCAQICCWLK